MHVPIANTKKNVQKIINTEYYMNLSIHFSLKEKKIFLSKKGKEIYKLRAIHSEGAFSEIKEIQEFIQSKRIGRKKVEIDLILEAIVLNIKKNKKPLKCDINLKKIVLFFLLKITPSSTISIFSLKSIIVDCSPSEFLFLKENN